MSANPPCRILRFSTFEVNLDSGELRQRGQKVKLQEQPFQVLAALLERSGEVVSREELRRRLWPTDTFVDFDHSLNAAIKRLRDALGDSADNPVFIETMARRGYRFVYPLNGSVPQVAHKSKLIRKWQVIASAAILVIAGLSVGWFVAGSIRQKPLKERRLTANSGEASLKAASISPDGKLLAYADVTGMYLRHVDTAEIKSLPLPAGFDLISVSWFPDNSHLVIAGVAAAGQKPSTWQMSTMTGSFRRLIDDAREAAVSPDGKYIVFLRDKLTDSGVEKQIWLAQSDGADSHKLLVEVDADTRFGPVVWSPGGKQLAYLRVRGGPVSIHGTLETIRITSGQPRVILAGPHFREALCWSRDGRIFFSNAGQEDPNLADTGVWAIPVDELTGEAKGKPEQITKEPSGISSFSLTADAKRYGFRMGQH